MTNKEAINLLDNLIGMVEDNQNSDYDQALKMAIDALKQLERKRGQWIDLKCSICGQVDMSKPNFCPNCGADMRGEQE